MIVLFGKEKYRYLDMFALYIKLVPLTAVLRLINYAISFIVPTLQIIVTAYFIDTAVDIVSNGRNAGGIVLPVILLISFSLYDYLSNIGFSLLNCRAENKIKIKVQPELTGQMAKVKYRYYENRETMDVITRATDNFIGNITGMFNLVFDFLSVIFRIGGFILLLGLQLWWASILLAVLCVPIYILGYRSGRKKYDTDKRLTKIDRKFGYIKDILIGRENIEERYMFGYVDKLSGDFKKDYEYARKERNKTEKRRWIDMKSTSMIIALSSIAIIGVLIQPTINGDITIGTFTALAGNIFGLGNALSWNVAWNISEFKYKFEYVKDLNTFLSYETNGGMTDLPAESHPALERVEFRNVSFKYPGTEVYILKNMNFTLSAGKHYAIVGANGAGKTAVTKLLTGLYDEYEGEIYVNGRNLREYTQSELHALSAVVYQDFSRYPVDFHDNIALGDVLHMDNTPSVENAVSVLGLTEAVEKLPDKLKTPLTKIKENGVDLSGGEWQRVALARLIVNPAPLKILDEPTAALDPISESRVYEQFGSIADKKSRPDNIVIFISHRLGSTKLADEILVVSDGVIAEQGTFSELTDKNGVFSEMYTAQAEWYRETAVNAS